jgi:putative transposon-encoded protein
MYYRQALTAVWIVIMTSAAALGAINFYAIHPSETTVGINPDYDNHHQVYFNPDAVARNKLVLFLPGSGSSPDAYRLFPQLAAENGFHVINLMYLNSYSFVAQTITNDCDVCYVQMRTEILTGEDLSASETVDRNNSIEHRLIKVLEYLQATYPQEKWSQYLSGTNIIWKNMVVAGHSQGAGEVGFIAKRHLVDRALVFSSGDWFSLSNRPATWVLTPGVTPANRYFGAAHTNDPLFPDPHQLAAWGAMGITNFGPIVFAEDERDPQFACARILRTSVEPRNNFGDVAYHGAMISDFHTPMNEFNLPMFRRMWEYMLFGRIKCSTSFDGDTIQEIGAYHPSSGTWHLLTTATGLQNIAFGGPGMVPVDGNYDNDLSPELCLYEKKSGMWYRFNDNDATIATQFGNSRMIPVPADYDGDYVDDLAVFEPSTGTWYIQQSKQGFRVEQFGSRTMLPVPADYDGDGRVDVAVFESRSATWYLSQSSEGFSTITFGPKGCWPVHGDYDGDGVSDPATYDPMTSTWYLHKSYEPVTTVQFGYRGVIPLNRDYDGDGRADIGVYDPALSGWYVSQSQSGFREVTLGQRYSIPLGTPIGSLVSKRGWFQ